MADNDVPATQPAHDTPGKKGISTHTTTGDEAIPVSVLEDGSLDPVYEAKAKVLNKAIQDIGMGRYQWQVCFPL